MKTLIAVFAVSISLTAQDWQAARIVGMADYPVLARHAGIAGRVSLHCVSELEEEPPVCSIVSGHELLGPAAKANAEQWRFRVASGSSVRVDLIYEFRLTKSGSTRERPPATFVFTFPNVVTVTSAQGCGDHQPCPDKLSADLR